MKQLILPSEYNGEEIYTLPKEDSHYLLNVQRRSIGFELSILNIQGVKFKGRIIDIKNNLCCLQLKKIDGKINSQKEIILFQAIPKGKKIDLMIRQAVETGVNKIFPITADHSVPQFKTKTDKDKKRERWNKIIKEASQQSGTQYITELKPIQSFLEALKSLEKPYTGIFFHQVPMENKPLHSLLASTKDKVVIVIGPEGGLSEKEVKLLTEFNFSPALLGNNILRAETATIFSIGAVQMILNERDSWVHNK